MPSFAPFSSLLGDSLLVIIVLGSLCPRRTRRPTMRTGCQWNKSLAASLRVAVVPRVGCDLPLLLLPSSLSPLCCNLHHCLSRVSARGGPRTCPSQCLLLPPLPILPPPSSVCSWRDAALLLARVLPSSMGWDVICLPCPHCHVTIAP
jgi:hypothetical protein